MPDGPRCALVVEIPLLGLVSPAKGAWRIGRPGGVCALLALFELRLCTPKPKAIAWVQLVRAAAVSANFRFPCPDGAAPRAIGSALCRAASPDAAASAELMRSPPLSPQVTANRDDPALSFRQYYPVSEFLAATRLLRFAERRFGGNHGRCGCGSRRGHCGRRGCCRSQNRRRRGRGRARSRNRRGRSEI